MTTEFKPEPAMHISSTDYDAISILCKKMIDSGMYKNSVKFPLIPILEATFKDDLATFDGYRASAKGNADNTKLRNKWGKTMYGYLKNNLTYAKLVCGNDIDLIILSGYDSSLPPEAATIPLTRNIKDIVKGPEADMITVKLEKAQGTKKQRRERKTYSVRVFLSEDATAFTEGCVSSDSRKLVIRNVPKGETRYYQIVIQNSAGSNELAGKVRYNLN